MAPQTGRTSPGGGLVTWIAAALVVLIAAGVMVRLGFWQLDRLEQRRTENAQIEAGMSQPALDLATGVPADLGAMAFREVVATGEYLEKESILLRNQAWEGETGYHLISPLRIAGREELLLVDRGFVPLADNSPAALEKYAEPGTVTVQGRLQPFLPKPTFTGVPDAPLTSGETRLLWNFLGFRDLQVQYPEGLMNAWLLAVPEPGNPAVRTLRETTPAPDLSEGPHLGYALQWFAFALILVIMFGIYARNHAPFFRR